MTENENVLQNEVQPAPDPAPLPEPVKPSKGKQIGAAIKEWLRKRTVALKRATHNIPFVFTVIVSMLWLIWLFTFSKSVYLTSAATWTGMAVFANTMLSILIVPLFLSAFPKRKKPNIVFIVLIFVFMVAIVLCDVLYYIQQSNYLANQDIKFLENNPCLNQSLKLAIVHIALIGVAALLLAFLPLYKKLILKINTKKVVEDNALTEEIDTSEEEQTI